MPITHVKIIEAPTRAEMETAITLLLAELPYPQVDPESVRMSLTVAGSFYVTLVTWIDYEEFFHPGPQEGEIAVPFVTGAKS